MTLIEMHVFGDASILANCAAVYTVVYQQVLLTRDYWLASLDYLRKM